MREEKLSQLLIRRTGLQILIKQVDVTRDCQRHLVSSACLFVAQSEPGLELIFRNIPEMVGLRFRAKVDVQSPVVLILKSFNHLFHGVTCIQLIGLISCHFVDQVLAELGIGLDQKTDQ